jgi:hypothetical protein
MRAANFYAGLMVAGLAFTAPARAALIAGELNIAGAVRVTANALDFFPAGGGDGIFRIDAYAQQGSFLSVAGTMGDSRDLNSADHPVGEWLNFANFLTFDTAPNLIFTLQYVEPGIFTAAGCGASPRAGQTCTPFPGSQFNLNNLTSRSSVASFAVRGIVSDGSGSAHSTFLGTYTTQFTNQNLQQVLAAIGSGGAVQATYSANFIVIPVPEPGTISLFVAGGLIIGAIQFARRRRP